MAVCVRDPRLRAAKHLPLAKRGFFLIDKLLGGFFLGNITTLFLASNLSFAPWKTKYVGIIPSTSLLPTVELTQLN